jgi:hypothetical protein
VHPESPLVSVAQFSVRCCVMSAVAHSNFEVFAEAFVRAYWETIKGGAFSMPPNEPVDQSIEELLAEVSHRTEFHPEGSLHELHMENTHGDWWRFSFRATGRRWQLVGASARSDSETPHDLLGPVYSRYFAPLLRHVEKVTNDTKSI